VVKIEKALKGVSGVEEAKVHFNTGRIVVEHDPGQTNADELIKTVRAAGYEAKVAPF
jgi:copper chaperone CopZ